MPRRAYDSLLSRTPRLRRVPCVLGAGHASFKISFVPWFTSLVSALGFLHLRREHALFPGSSAISRDFARANSLLRLLPGCGAVAGCECAFKSVYSSIPAGGAERCNIGV